MSFTNISSNDSNVSPLDDSYWHKHVKLKQASGLTRVGYCRKNNLNLYQLKYHEHKLISAAVNAKLLPIKLLSNEVASKDTANFMKESKLLCKLKLKHGNVLKVYDIDTLSIILEKLK